MCILIRPLYPNIEVFRLTRLDVLHVGPAADNEVLNAARVECSQQIFEV